VGSGNLSLGAVNTYAGPTNIQEGTLTLELGADLGPAPISLSNKVTLVINGAGRDLSTKFGSVAADSLVVFNGSDSKDTLKLPSGFSGKTLNIGMGGIQVGTAAASGNTIDSGVTVSLTNTRALVSQAGGALKLDGQMVVSPATSSEVVDIPKLEGKGKFTLQGGSAVIVASPAFSGTTSLSAGASAVLTGGLGIGSGAALELAGVQSPPG
jgi:autotransporter-associated beta strand protein